MISNLDFDHQVAGDTNVMDTPGVRDTSQIRVSRLLNKPGELEEALA
jgi:hypothetical protein